MIVLNIHDQYVFKIHASLPAYDSLASADHDFRIADWAYKGLASSSEDIRNDYLPSICDLAGIKKLNGANQIGITLSTKHIDRVSKCRATMIVPNNVHFRGIILQSLCI